MKKCIAYLESQGAKAIVLGCTEFPLLLTPETIDKENITGQVHIISSTYCLARKAIDYVYDPEKEQLFKCLGIRQQQNSGQVRARL